jgi:hypothetical protein
MTQWSHFEPEAARQPGKCDELHANGAKRRRKGASVGLCCPTFELRPGQKR